MSKKTKIIIWIVGGAVTGGLSACIAVWPDFTPYIASAVGLISSGLAAITGFSSTASE